MELKDTQGGRDLEKENRELKTIPADRLLQMEALEITREKTSIRKPGGK